MGGQAKVFKDPIYGYIKIQNTFVSTFIDTPCFQRLRHIKQTSYSPLYMTATHNRFAHSLGVYHLGEIVYKQIISFMSENMERFNFKQDIIQWVTTHEDLFLAACLLHDVGHAPFSHTSEKFYEIHIKNFMDSFFDSIDAGKKTILEDDASKRLGAQPHEHMSVIIALQTFNDYFGTKSADDKDFFARCITGYTYTNAKTVLAQVKNCIIELLNSKLIDVDKLDYIIRDAFVSGYQNVAIDYKRLLGGMVIVRDKNEIVLAYHKSAMSVIQNVVYAHDYGREWIQNHPVIVYENFLLNHCIKKIQAFFDSISKAKEMLFSINSLTEKGNTFGDKSTGIINISLLSDVDILFFIKNEERCQDSLTREYFNRNSRRHPLWKSEEEYHSFIGIEDKTNREKINEVFEEIDKLFAVLAEVKKINLLPVINDEALKIINDEYKKETEQDEKIKFERCTAYFKILKNFSVRHKIDFDFVIRPVSGFQSNFSKLEIKKIKIWYPHDQKSIESTRRLTTLSADKEENNYFYFYIKHKDMDKKIGISDFSRLCGDLIKKYYALHQPE